MARSTIDVDLIADIEPGHIMALMDRLNRNYYIDETTIVDAISRGSSFNLIHLETSIKLDVFIPKDEIYHHTAMGRRHRDTLFEENKITEIYFCSGSLRRPSRKQVFLCDRTRTHAQMK
jgi:hypothetical protein